MTITPATAPHAADSSSGTLQRLQEQFANDPVLGVIQQNLPDAFSSASISDQQGYRLALRASRHARADLKRLLKSLKGLSEFAKPLLSQALDTRFGPGFEPQTDTLFHPTLRPSGATGYATQLTLLEAALHNFDRKEATSEGFLRSASIYKGVEDPHPKNIRPEVFADLCRHLNIGRKYQDHLEEVLEPVAQSWDSPTAVLLNAQAIFIANDLADMELYARAAFLRKHISEPAQAAILEVVNRQSTPMFNGLPVAFECITLFGVEIPRVVLIKPQATWTFTQVPLVLYVPQDPVAPFKEFASLDEVEDELRSRLMSPSYQAFFARLLGERARAPFFSQLNRHLFPLAPVDGSWFTRGLWHNAPDKRADLRLQSNAIYTDLLQRMYQQQIHLIKDNARFVAVPTEDEDAKSRQERLRAWIGIGMNIANVASFMIPVLGQVLMVYASVELIGEVYHGIEDLTHGDFEEGFEHLVSAGANIAFMAALANTAHGAVPPEPATVTANNFVGAVVPIKLDNGQMRLWKPDLEPFQSHIERPADASLDLDGLFEQDGKKYLTLDGRHYPVVHNKSLNKWQIKHPWPDATFSPALEHNGVGAFRHIAELPQQWAKEKLFKRLGHSVSGLSDIAAEQILNVVDVDEAFLRRVHIHSAVPPGQLRDTLKRFQLDASLDNAPLDSAAGSTRVEQFQALYAASERGDVPLLQSMRRQFPGLPVNVAEDLIATLTSLEQQQLLDSGRIPLRVNEAAAWQLQQTRLNRAFEGFYLRSVPNADTETLSLSLLQKLPGWSADVRLEVRDGTRHGALLHSIGNPEAAQLKVLVKSNGCYQAFDAEGNALNSVPKTGNNLCLSILHALPDEPRRAIGFAHVEQGPQLNAALARLAMTDRAQASRLLGMRTTRLTFNLPVRLKQGRLGYPLSGNGKLQGFVSDDHLLDRIGLLELDDVAAQDVLTGLRLEGMSNADINARLDVLQDERQVLRVSLDRWALASSELLNPTAARMTSRTRIGEAILQHWQATSLPGVPAGVALRLESVWLSDFPAQLPDFFYSRVERLQLSNVAAHFGEAGPGVGEMLRDAQTLELFLGRFPQVTVLEISRPVASRFSFMAFHDLPRIIPTQLPGLRELSLIHQGLHIDTETLNAFGRMQHLESLDLSGNLSMAEPAPGSVNLNLSRLVLDRIGLERWPDWLTQLLPEHIGEVSLVGNQIDFVPIELMLTGPVTTRTALVRLQGNRLSRAEIIEACLRGASPDQIVRIDTGVSAELQPRIDALLSEQSDLEAALGEWARASSSLLPLNDEAVAMRQALGLSLRDHWRATVSGRVSRPVLIDSVALSEFPQHLPESFYQNTNSLLLRNVTSEAEQLNVFLSRFSQLEALEIVGHVIPMAAPPQVLSTLSSLRTLALVDQGLLIDQAALEYLSSLGHLRSLDLSANHLGTITSSAALERHWETLTLDNLGISTWPEWLDYFLPGGIDALSLAHNQLTELPAQILRNPRNRLAHTEITLEGNPLSRETMISAHVSELDNSRSYSFYMDLPADILALPPERAASSIEGSDDSGSDLDLDSDSDSDSSSHRHGSTGAGNAAAASIDQWLDGTPQERLDHQAVWDQIEAAGDAPMLLALIGRLRETADYLRARDALVQRVWHVLGAAANDPQMRQLLNAMADEAIASRTCGDGVRLEFNQMEVQVFALDALRDIPLTERGPTLYRLARRFYRLDEVDRLARLNAGTRDQAEVRLAYRLLLAERLDLPLPPARMLYRTAAAVTTDELLNVEGLVLTSQDGPGFFASVLDRDYWVAWLRETYASEFAELKATFEAERSRVEDEFAELDDAYLARIKALDEQQKMREQELIKQLTYREGMKYST